MGTQQLNWTQIEFPNLPSPRIFSSLVLDSNKNIALLFGGRDSSASNRKDFWSTDGSKWEQPQASNTPLSWALASMAYDEAHQMDVLFGGSGDNGMLGDTWLLDQAVWSQQQPLNSPAPRSNACMAFDAARSVTILFGGYIYAGGLNYLTSNEMWAWDGTNWEQFSSAILPPGRLGAKMVYDRAHQSMLLFGGGYWRRFI